MSDRRTILILSANPKGTDPLRLGEEVREIKVGLKRSKYRDLFQIETAEAVRVSDIHRAMLDYEPNIVHFSGHGAGTEGLVFEDETGQVKFVSAEGLAGLFSLFSDTLDCVLLNACYSEVQAQEISQHIDYVIGMSQAIGDRAAIVFAVGFYDAIGAGRTIEFAYELGCVAIQTEIQANKTGDRKLIPVDIESKNLRIAEHLKPVLKQRKLMTNFTPLENLLKQRRWKEADQETFALMLKIAHCEKKQYLDVEDLQGFPFEDLKTIDNLWVTHSNGHFGFSVQNEIWKSQEISGTPHSGVTTFRAFGDQVGWRIKSTVEGKTDSTWRDYKIVLFSLQAPKGHLPWGGWGDPGHFKRWRIGYLLARFD